MELGNLDGDWLKLADVFRGLISELGLKSNQRSNCFPTSPVPFIRSTSLSLNRSFSFYFFFLVQIQYSKAVAIFRSATSHIERSRGKKRKKAYLSKRRSTSESAGIPAKSDTRSREIKPLHIQASANPAFQDKLRDCLETSAVVVEKGGGDKQLIIGDYGGLVCKISAL